MPDELSPELSVRLLRAKSAELESRARQTFRKREPREIDYLALDIAMLASLLADHIERTA